jgi:excinuclease ABC subunit C
MVFQSEKVDFKKCNSVLEALILEANLIKKHQPKYNTKEKDNKSFNYVIITKEDWPRILTVRGREIDKGLNYDIKNKFGPFTNGESLRVASKIIRKIFPFRDKCMPQVGKPCFNRQLGLCPGVCDGTISKKDYSKIIKKIEMLLSGKINSLKNNLKKEMKSFAKNGEYEKAGEIKKQIFSLEHIQDVAFIASEATTFFPPQLRRGDYSDNRGGCFRIEAYDVAHLSGTNNVGVMVVWENGQLKKSDYRKFLIRNSKGNDIGALEEILQRRLKHTEWPTPDLIVVDGGMGQLNVASSKPTATVVAVTKDDRHKPKVLIGDENIIKKFRKEILLVNHEAHRFAITFYRQKSRKSYY